MQAPRLRGASTYQKDLHSTVRRFQKKNGRYMTILGLKRLQIYGGYDMKFVTAKISQRTQSQFERELCHVKL
jgi:hypothetical protein